MKYNIYMIEDKKEKHENFLRIIERANNLARERNKGVEFCAGFGYDAEEARKRAMTPECIVEALQDPTGLYLVDLELKRFQLSDPNPLDFLSYCTEQNEMFGKAARYYRELYNKHNEISEFAVAIHVLFFCHLHNKRCCLISTEIAGGKLYRFRELVPIFYNTDGFPSMPPDDISDKKIEQWAEELLKMMDPFRLILDWTLLWFSKNVGAGWESFEKHGPPHDFANLCEDKRRSMIPKYQECVKRVFSWAKEEWCDIDEKIISLHQCLKTVVGTPAQWMGTSHDKPLSLAGAYLVFLIALSIKSHCSLSDYLVDDWRCFCAGDPKPPTPLPFMPSQNKECADRTIRSLYEFFLQIILLQDGTFGLGGFFPPRPSHPYFGIKLKWPDKDLKRLADGIRMEIAAAFGSTDCQLKLPGGKTVGTFFRFLVASQASDCGFGAVGTIRLDYDFNENADKKGWLWIGQFEALQ